MSRMYIWEAEFSPTSTVARPGTMPFLSSFFTLWAVSVSTSAARAFPSIIKSDHIRYLNCQYSGQVRVKGKLPAQLPRLLANLCYGILVLDIA